MALAPNEGKGAIVLMAVGLLALVGTAFGIFVGLGKSIDGEALLAERFAFTTPPMQLSLSRAHQLGNGDRLAELVPAEGATEAPLDRVVLHAYEDPESPAISFPDEPRELRPEALERWAKEPKGVLRGELERGRVAFDRWDVVYVRERVYRPEWGADLATDFVDVLRVNLSNEELPCILYAYFPRGVDGDAEVLRRLLDELELR